MAGSLWREASAGVLLPGAEVGAPGLGLRVRLAERLEVDWSAFVVVSEGGLFSGMGRAGGAVGLYEGPRLAAAFLFGLGGGGFAGTGLLLGADAGAAGWSGPWSRTRRAPSTTA